MNENIIPNELLFKLIKKISILESQKGFYNDSDKDSNDLNIFEFDETFSQPKFFYDLTRDKNSNVINFFL